MSIFKYSVPSFSMEMPFSSYNVMCSLLERIVPQCQIFCDLRGVDMNNQHTVQVGNHQHIAVVW